MGPATGARKRIILRKYLRNQNTNGHCATQHNDWKKRFSLVRFVIPEVDKLRDVVCFHEKDTMFDVALARISHSTNAMARTVAFCVERKHVRRGQKLFTYHLVVVIVDVRRRCKEIHRHHLQVDSSAITHTSV